MYPIDLLLVKGFSNSFYQDIDGFTFTLHDRPLIPDGYTNCLHTVLFCDTPKVLNITIKVVSVQYLATLKCHSLDLSNNWNKILKTRHTMQLEA